MKIIENRLKVFALSGAIIIIGLVIMLLNAGTGKGLFNYDVEFAGGTSYTFDIGTEFENSDIEAIIAETTGQNSPQVQKVAGTNQVQIKLLNIEAEERAAFTAALEEKYGIDNSALLNMSDVSATISSEMRNNAFLAVFVACIAMLIYVSFRFKDWKMGASSIIALLHDASIVVLAFAVLRIPLNYSFIAVILTILGYSINSTIVIFDRVRENRRMNSKLSKSDLVDKSVSQTIRRSLYTSFTTLLPVVCLFLFGVTSIKQFTLPIIIGVVVGTYSSIYLSGSVWYTFSKKNKR